MKKIMGLIVLLLLVFTPVSQVKATSASFNETPSALLEENELIENGPLNESSAFANIVIFIKFADETTYEAPFDYAHYENMFNDADGISLKNYFLEPQVLAHHFCF